MAPQRLEEFKYRGLDYACQGVAVELSVPASAQLRQLAMWYHMKGLTETADLFDGDTLRDDVVDLKETLRLRYISFVISPYLFHPCNNF